MIDGKMGSHMTPERKYCTGPQPLPTTPYSTYSTLMNLICLCVIIIVSVCVLNLCVLILS